MSTYTIKGARYLRKYTADTLTPTYAAIPDASRISRTLCECAWEASSADEATMPSHSNEMVKRDTVEKSGLDWNVVDREHFDAATWCAEHSGGSHRAYANAACYVFKLPAMDSYPNLLSIKVRVTSDPYNISGARIAALTRVNATIPTACALCRAGQVHADGVAPHTVVTDAKGNQTWYPTIAETTLTKASWALSQYIMIYVMKEDYGETRGNWLEGSSYIDNAVEIEVDGDITGWTNGGTYDCCSSDAGMIFSGGSHIVADIRSVPRTGSGSGMTSVVASLKGDIANIDSAGTITNISDLIENASERITSIDPYGGVQAAYNQLLSGSANIIPANEAYTETVRPGVGFNISMRSNGTVASYQDSKLVYLTTSVLQIPFALPFSKNNIMIRFWWGAQAVASALVRFNFWYRKGYFIDYEGDVVRNGNIYSADKDEVESWKLFGSVNARSGQADFKIDKGIRFMTVLVSAFLDWDGIAWDSLSTERQIGSSNFYYKPNIATAANRLTGRDTLIFPTVEIFPG